MPSSRMPRQSVAQLDATTFWFNYPGGSRFTNGSVFGRIAGENAAKSAFGCAFFSNAPAVKRNGPRGVGAESS